MSVHENPNPLLKTAGGLALAAVMLGLSLLLLTCSGFDAALYFCPAVLALGTGAGVLICIASRHSPSTEAGPVLAAGFMAFIALLGGLLELAVWLHWPVLFNQHN